MWGGTAGIGVASGQLPAGGEGWSAIVEDEGPLASAMAGSVRRPGEILVDASLLSQVPDGIEVEPAGAAGDGKVRPLNGQRPLPLGDHTRTLTTSSAASGRCAS